MATKFIKVEDYGFDPNEGIAPRSMRIGFIGIGIVACEMVGRLLGAGHRVTVCDHAGGEVAALHCAGASLTDNIREACCADVVFTLLPTEELVRAVVLGDGGVCECLPRGAIHVDSSRISVDLADQLVEAHWEAGNRYVSAPVSTDKVAGFDQLFLIAGGREDALLEIEPLLDAIGEVSAQFSGWPADANLLHISTESAAAPAPPQSLVQFTR